MATYQCSDGSRLEKSVIDQRIAKAKIKYTNLFEMSHDHIFCERCKKNHHGCSGNSASHIISTDECQKSGRSELAFDLTIFERLGDKCHRKLETWKHEKRESWYWARLNQYTFEEFEEEYDQIFEMGCDRPEYMCCFQGLGNN